MKKSSKFVRLLAAAAMVVVGALSASAENINLVFEDPACPLVNSYIEYQNTGAAYPNFHVNYNGNTEGYTGCEVKATITGTGDNTFSWSQTATQAAPDNGTTSHTWFYAGEMKTAGTYNLEVQLRFYTGDGDARVYQDAKNYNTTFALSGVDESSQVSITYSQTPVEGGTDFDYTITLPTGKTEADVETVRVVLLKGGQPFDAEDAFSASTLSGKIEARFEGARLSVWMKGQVKFTDGTTKDVTPNDVAMDLVSLAGVPVTTVNYTLTVGEFTRTGNTSGTLPYTITLEDGANPKDVAKWKVWASRVGDEEMDVKEIPVAEIESYPYNYTQSFTALPEATTTHIWPKVQAVYRDGTTGPAVQQEIDVNTADTGTGISDVTVAADGEAAYYNLQGVRMAEPVAGQIYIVVKDGKATKAVVR